MYITISSSDLAEEKYVGTQKQAYKRAKQWLSDTKKKLSLSFDPEFEEDEVEWTTTLAGDFYYEDADKLKARLLQEFKQRFKVELGGNCVDLSPGSIVVRVRSCWKLFDAIVSVCTAANPILANKKVKEQPQILRVGTTFHLEDETALAKLQSVVTEEKYEGVTIKQVEEHDGGTMQREVSFSNPPSKKARQASGAEGGGADRGTGTGGGLANAMGKEITREDVFLEIDTYWDTCPKIDNDSKMGLYEPVAGVEVNGRGVWKLIGREVFMYYSGVGSDKLEEGDKVWLGSGKLEEGHKVQLEGQKGMNNPGTISQCNLDGTYDFDHLNGTREKGVEKRYIKVLGDLPNGWLVHAGTTINAIQEKQGRPNRSDRVIFSNSSQARTPDQSAGLMSSGWIIVNCSFFPASSHRFEDAYLKCRLLVLLDREKFVYGELLRLGYCLGDRVWIAKGYPANKLGSAGDEVLVTQQTVNTVTSSKIRCRIQSRGCIMLLLGEISKTRPVEEEGQ
jgi:hypothetical protein